MIYLTIWYYWTFRELYYGNTQLFEHDYNVRKALLNISCILDTFSWNLGFPLSSTGLVAGNLSIYMKDGEVLDCSKMIEGKKLELAYLCAKKPRISVLYGNNITKYDVSYPLKSP